tara:strand:- start:5995 stop:6303 length:309 start_codon:yes stop_codon:yes gene_type:complete
MKQSQIAKEIGYAQVDALIAKVEKNLGSCNLVAVVYDKNKQLQVIRDQSTRFDKIHLLELVGVYDSSINHMELRDDINEAVAFYNKKRQEQIKEFNNAMGLQ